MHRIYILYTAAQRAISLHIATDLADAGCDILPETTITAEMQTALQHLDAADLVVALLPDDPFGHDWFRETLARAHESGKFVHRIEATFRQTAPYPRLISTTLHALRRHLPQSQPYPGLAPFSELDAERFFGRGVFVRRALRSLQHNRILAVVGDSNSGKTSFLRAGLHPLIRAGALDAQRLWRVLSLAVSTHPVQRFAERLCWMYNDDAMHDPITPGDVEEALQSSAGIARLLHDLTNSVQRTGVYIAIDHLENLFTSATDSEQAQFLDILATLTGLVGDQIRVAVAMRTEMYGELRHYPSLADSFNDADAVLNLDLPTADDLPHIIRAPAEPHKFRIEDELLARIVADYGKDPSLAALQCILHQLVAHDEESLLTVENYEALGALSRAVEEYAETSFQQLSEAHQRQLRVILLRLIDISPYGYAVSRELPQSDLLQSDLNHDDVEFLIERLAVPWVGLLNKITRPTGDDLVTILRVGNSVYWSRWSRFGAWLEDDRASLIVEGRIRKAAETWQAQALDPSYLLLGPALREAEEWLQTHVATNLQRAFIEASLCEHDERLRRQRRQQRREFQWRWFRRLGLSALLLTAIIIALWGLQMLVRLF